MHPFPTAATPFPPARPDPLFSQRIEKAIASEVIGQPRAVHAVTRALVCAFAGLRRGDGPLGVMLFLGPPGTGKSHLCRVLARLLSGPQALPVTIDCQLLRDQFELFQIAQLLRAGAPQHGPPVPPPIVVFDRLDAAPEGFKKLLSSILDQGSVPGPDGRPLDFGRSLCILLGALGAKEILRLTEERIGFGPQHDLDDDEAAEEAEEELFKQCFETAEDFWGPQVMSRVERTVIFRRLEPAHICRILDLKVARLRSRLQARGMDFALAESARDFLIDKSLTDLRYGAWRLQHNLSKYLEYPLGDLMLSGRIGPGLTLHVSQRLSRLHFSLARLPAAPATAGAVAPPAPDDSQYVRGAAG